MFQGENKNVIRRRLFRAETFEIWFWVIFSGDFFSKPWHVKTKIQKSRREKGAAL
jgi:hypothetical protein